MFCNPAGEPSIHLIGGIPVLRGHRRNPVCLLVHNAPILDQGRARLSGHERHGRPLHQPLPPGAKGHVRGTLPHFLVFLVCGRSLIFLRLVRLPTRGLQRTSVDPNPMPWTSAQASLRAKPELESQDAKAQEEFGGFPFSLTSIFPRTKIRPDCLRYGSAPVSAVSQVGFWSRNL